MPEIWFPNLGIEIDHLSRTAFTVFGQDIYWYGIFIGLGVILGVLLALHEAKRTGQNPDTYLDFIIYAMIIAIIGARLYYVIFSWDFYSQHPEKIFAIREGGLAIYGGIIGACIAVVIYSRCPHGHCLQPFEKEKLLGYGGYHGTIFDSGTDAGSLGQLLQ